MLTPIEPVTGTDAELWLLKEVKRLEHQFSFFLGFQHAELAEAYHQKLIEMRFLLRQEQEQ